MVGRFTAKRAAPAESIPLQEPSPALEGMSWSVFPDPAADPAAPAIHANLLLTDKLLEPRCACIAG
jgi:hypothetical protein